DLGTTLDYKVRPDGTVALWCGMSELEFRHDPTPKALLAGLADVYRREAKRLGVRLGPGRGGDARRPGRDLLGGAGPAALGDPVARHRRGRRACLRGCGGLGPDRARPGGEDRRLRRALGAVRERPRRRAARPAAPAAAGPAEG